MNSSAPYIVPEQPGRWRAMILAILLHLILLVGFLMSMHWRHKTPQAVAVAVAVEMWSPPQETAKSPPAAPVVSEPVKEKPAPPTIKASPVQKPDIVVEQEKETKKRAEQQAQEQARMREQQRRRVEEIRAMQAMKEKKEKQEAAAKQKARVAEQQRQANLQRMLAQANTGHAAQSQDGYARTNYADKVAAIIRSNTVFDLPSNLAGNPTVEYIIKLLPNGNINSMQKMKASNMPSFDAAVERAIERSQPFPPDQDGKVPSQLTLIHRARE